jgi:signal transduction histidine kinase
VVEIADGLRAHVDAWAEPAVAAELAKRVRELIAPWEGAPRTWRAGRDDADATRVGDTQGIPTEESDTGTSSVAVDVSGAHDARTLLRVEPERIDELMAAAGELLFDRNRIERRVQLLRTLTRELGRARQALRDAVGGELAAHHPLASIEGQVATLSTQLAQTSAALLDETEAMRRTLGDLQRGLTRVRMQTARALFAQLARALRAAARAAGVKVELRTRGEDTEFDKAVAEKITDPLIQLLRNAVAHGIEPATERVLGGKAAVGAIAIAARAEGNLVVIEVADDGRGVDAGRLRTRLVEAGRWSAARAALASDDEVVAALFDPGVSSKDEADELAGRGVGLDLVREAIARLGGEIRMASAPGRGTTFTLRLPVSTAVTHAMLFKVHGQVYALPNAQVIDTLVVEADAATHPVGGEPVAVLDLGQLLATPGHHPEASGRRPAVVVAYADKRVVCTVDKIVGPARDRREAARPAPVAAAAVRRRDHQRLGQGPAHPRSGGAHPHRVPRPHPGRSGGHRADPHHPGGARPGGRRLAGDPRGPDVDAGARGLDRRYRRGRRPGLGPGLGGALRSGGDRSRDAAHGRARADRAVAWRAADRADPDRRGVVAGQPRAPSPGPRARRARDRREADHPSQATRGPRRRRSRRRLRAKTAYPIPTSGLPVARPPRPVVSA